LTSELAFISLKTGQTGGDLAQEFNHDPKIDDATQEPENCKDSVAWVECLPAPEISCRLANGTELKFSGKEVGFNRTVPCRNVSGYSYRVAVALSLFLGWLGADRFYLGYPALGLLKFCTVGFCGIGSLVDFMLISMQIVGPSDGSNYIKDAEFTIRSGKEEEQIHQTVVIWPRKASWFFWTPPISFTCTPTQTGQGLALRGIPDADGARDTQAGSPGTKALRTSSDAARQKVRGLFCKTQRKKPQRPVNCTHRAPRVAEETGCETARKRLAPLARLTGHPVPRGREELNGAISSPRQRRKNRRGGWTTGGREHVPFTHRPRQRVPTNLGENG
ncbi:hypothetical protein SKAU_G00054090, partial [Synaphobranchus kaupii]